MHPFPLIAPDTSNLNPGQHLSFLHGPWTPAFLGNKSMTPKPHSLWPSLGSLPKSPKPLPGSLSSPPSTLESVLTTLMFVSCSFWALSSRRLAMTASSAFFRLSLRTFSSVSGKLLFL